jgi:VCBS repeat-containing protein
VKVQVIVSPDFIPFLAPTSVSIAPGNGVVLGSTSLTSIGGYVGTLQVAVQPSSSYLTATLNSPTITLAAGQVVQDMLTIGSSDSTPLGPYTVTFSATGPVKTVTVTVNVGRGGGGGGGGSVLGGTFVYLANHTQVMVQNLGVGMQLRSYNMTTHQFLNTTITKFTSVTVNNYMTIITTSQSLLTTDQNPMQKVYVMFPNATWTLLPVTQLQVGYYLFQPETGTWAQIIHIRYHTGGSYTMYDIYNTDPHDYIANGYLDPWKE